MEKVETHFVETKDYVYRTKVDLVKNESDEIIRFKIVCYDRVVEFDKNKDPINEKNKTTNVNILLNRVRIDEKNNFRKKITLVFFLILALSVIGLILLI